MAQRRFLSPLHRTTRQIERWFESRLPELAPAEGHLLTYLVPYGPCTVTELVRVFGMRHSTMTNVLDRLERAGHLVRKANPEDRRSFLIALTRKGKATAARVNALLDELERDVEKRLAKGELEGFARTMAAIEEAASRGER